MKRLQTEEGVQKYAAGRHVVVKTSLSWMPVNVWESVELNGCQYANPAMDS